MIFHRFKSSFTFGFYLHDAVLSLWVWQMKGIWNCKKENGAVKKRCAKMMQLFPALKQTKPSQTVQRKQRGGSFYLTAMIWPPLPPTKRKAKFKFYFCVWNLSAMSQRKAFLWMLMFSWSSRHGLGLSLFTICNNTQTIGLHSTVVYVTTTLCFQLKCQFC